MGIMLETASDRLSERGGPHFGSPDKTPVRRLEALRLAGEGRVPTTTGILIGIGETRRERIASLLALRDLSDRYGHIQEIIIQNFRAKPGTKMVEAPEPSMDDLCWTIAVARLLFGPNMSIQAPPNLYTGDLTELIGAGINDWGGVSPVTPDHVNPEAPWPHLEHLAAETKRAGHILVERLTVYPRYIAERREWIDIGLHRRILQLSDGAGLARTGCWSPGAAQPAAADDERDVALAGIAPTVISEVARLLHRLVDGAELDEREVATLFSARRGDLVRVSQAANELRANACGETVSYVVTRNINYTNICLQSADFVAFPRGRRTRPCAGSRTWWRLEIRRRVREAWDRGATEVCMQGGIHPSFTGETYLKICGAAKEAVPQIHVHAFSPLEVTHGAQTSGLSTTDFLRKLKAAGLGSLPGTAAEILDDEIRESFAPEKLEHQGLVCAGRRGPRGLPTTSTIMFGHVEGYVHWARHLLRLRDLQKETGGFTEFVPLPFVHMEAPMYLKGHSRQGPTLREVMLMHAVARLALHPHIVNIQVSWVKLGGEGVLHCLSAGVNDLGGTLMDESISRAAGAGYGQEMTPQRMEAIIRSAGRTPRQRNTLYADAPQERRSRSFAAGNLPRKEPAPAVCVSA